MSFPHPQLIPVLSLYLQQLPAVLQLLLILITANDGDGTVSSGDTFQWLVEVESSLCGSQNLSLGP